MIVISLPPVLMAVSLHLVYVVEWIGHGERPIPPHHGAQNVLEEVLYAAFALSFLNAVHLFVFWLAAYLTALMPFEPRIYRHRWTYLPLLTWAGGIATLIIDPIGAFDFWID